MVSLDAGGDSKMSHSNSVVDEGSAKKINADPPSRESNKIVPSPRDESQAGYVFRAEKVEIPQDQGQASVNKDNFACQMGAEVHNRHSSDQETESQFKIKPKGPESDLLPRPSKSIPSGNHGANKMFSQFFAELATKTSSIIVGTDTPYPQMEEKSGSIRKENSHGTKSERVLHQKSSQVAKSSRPSGPKGTSSRAGMMKGLSGLISSDEKQNSKSMIIQTPTLDLKSVSLNMSKGIGVDGIEERSSSTTHKSLSEWVPKEKRNDMMIEMLRSRVQELKNLDQEWSNWGNQKISDATRQLIQDRAELNNLRQERDEMDRFMKERQFREGNATNKLVDWQIAVDKANWQVQEADDTIRRLEKENAILKREMEEAKKHGAESSIRFQEVSRRENDAEKMVRSSEKEKSLLMEELMTQKRKLAKVQLEIKKEQELKEQAEVRLKQETKAKEEVLRQYYYIRKEREQIEKSAKAKEDMMKMAADKIKQRHLDDIKKFEEEIAQLRHKEESPIIAAMRKRLEGNPSGSGTKNDDTTAVSSEMVRKMSGLSLSSNGLKRERECVMCLTEERCVIFHPCAHQVLCTSCNELHEKKGMQVCPICRDPIHMRIPVNFDRSMEDVPTEEKSYYKWWF
ncbi:hypothetical protein RIF29_40595 [Crotalaria pallida]|uniref:RING-type domain-containing protein n=1 Tax=Crotalaria pallida TaxID=3830 RepID=A0AAN9HQU2_CROPI